MTEMSTKCDWVHHQGEFAWHTSGVNLTKTSPLPAQNIQTTAIIITDYTLHVLNPTIDD
jgi:hypothetical protein